MSLVFISQWKFYSDGLEYKCDEKDDSTELLTEMKQNEIKNTRKKS